MINVTSLLLSEGPEELRKALLYSPDEIRRCAARLSRSVRSPFILLVTCNRAEVYSAGDTIPASLLAGTLSLPRNDISRYSETAEGDSEAGFHLFCLSAGILSPYFGEEVIISQIGQAREIALSLGTSSAELDYLFRSAVSFSRRIHSRLKIRVFDEKCVKAAAALCRGRVLVIGSGEEARRIAAELVAGSHEVLETIRDTDKADFLIPQGVTAVPYEKRLEAALSADTVLSCSSAIGYTLTEEELRSLGDRLLIDLASPSDFPPSFPAIRSCGVTDELQLKVRRQVEEAAREECARLLDEFSKRDELPFVEALAVNTANTIIRKSSRLLSLEEDEGLASELYELCRKASISAYFQTEKTRRR